MSRGIMIIPDNRDGGFTSRNIDKTAEKNMSVSSWTFFYHEPYKCDWRQARIKAIDRKWKVIE